MEVPNSVLKYGFFVVLALLVAGSVFLAIQKHSQDVQLAQLRNEVAGRDQTIEVQKGLYTKLTLETDDMRSALDSKDQQVKELLDQVKKNKDEVLAADQLVLKWKKAFEGAATAKQTDAPPATPEGPTRKKVEFSKDWGSIRASGYTLTDPGEAVVKVEQLRALALTLAVAQDPSGVWHAYVSSSDDNTQVDIKVSAVNPQVTEPRWYEKVAFQATVGGGQSGLSFGVLAGVGVSYRIKQFDLGPAFFVTIGDRIDKYVGATVSWRPFER